MNIHAPKHPAMSPSENVVYIKLQAGLMALMLSLKTIKSPEDYAKHVAPLFEDVVFGALRYWDDDLVDGRITEWRKQIHDLSEHVRPTQERTVATPDRTEQDDGLAQQPNTTGQAGMSGASEP
jgi:hypothetical protein